MKRLPLLALAAGSVFAVSAFSATAFADTSTYVVHPGDSYFKIGQKVHQPYTLLEAINSPLKSALFAGQSIQLAERYTVHAGDSVWKIACAHGVSVDDIARWNHLANAKSIDVGRTLWLPPTTGHKPVVHSAPLERAQPVVHTVSAHTSSPSVSGQQVVNYAKRYIGVRYQWGGASTSGFDCSGLVKNVYGHFDIDLPRTAAQMHNTGSAVSRSALAPGDLVFFNTTGNPFSHVGIYAGNGQFISATSSHGVSMAKLDNPYYWGPRFTGATNLLNA